MTEIHDLPCFNPESSRQDRNDNSAFHSRTLSLGVGSIMSEVTRSEGGRTRATPTPPTPPAPELCSCHQLLLHPQPRAQSWGLSTGPSVSLCPGLWCCWGVEGTECRRRGKEVLPICPVTGHPPRMGTSLPAAPGGNKLLNSLQR